jgi:hypothetical protein
VGCLENNPHPACDCGQVFGVRSADVRSAPAVVAQRVGGRDGERFAGRRDDGDTAGLAGGQPIDQLHRSGQQIQHVTIEVHLTGHIHGP